MQWRLLAVLPLIGFISAADDINLSPDRCDVQALPITPDDLISRAVLQLL
jgi:hypothetical protein